MRRAPAPEPAAAATVPATTEAAPPRGRPGVERVPLRRGLAVGTLLAATLGVATWLVATGGIPFAVASDVFFLGALPLYAVCGALIVVRRRGNAIGWLYLVCPAVLLLGPWGEAVTARADRPLTGAAVLLAWAASWAYTVSIAPLFTAALLLFPTGRLPSRRWRPVAVATAIVLAAMWVSVAFRDGPLRLSSVVVDNPVGFPGSGPLLRGTETVASAAVGVVAVLAVASLVARFRAGDPVEREQLKWFTLAAGLFAGFYLVAIAAETAAAGPLASDVLWSLSGLGYASLPVATTVAILRYRLFEIDRILSRTLVYSALSLLLAAVYAAAVVVLGDLLSPVTGGSQLAVAGSTLVAAGSFGPARRRVQGAVDRRFNRARYDAQAAVGRFRGRLRDEVDLDTVRAELLAAVATTVEPTAASLWLRGAAPEATSQRTAPGVTGAQAPGPATGTAPVTLPERRRATTGT